MSELDRIADLEKQREEALANWKRYAQQFEDAEAACNANIKRIAELEALVSLAKTNWKAREATYKNSMDAIEAIAKERKERIAELEERLRVADKAYQALFDRCGGWPGIIAKEEHIAALEALLERVPHRRIVPTLTDCQPGCIACAYEALMKK